MDYYHSKCTKVRCVLYINKTPINMGVLYFKLINYFRAYGSSLTNNS